MYAAAATTMGTVTVGLSGQACVAQTRALVQRDVYDDFLAIAQGMTAIVSYGSPFDPETTAAPLINERQLARVLGYVEKGQQEGAFRIDIGAPVLTELFASLLFGLVDGERRGRVARASMGPSLQTFFMQGAAT